ncbi:LOW QUALITY PROTEIN: DNA-directed primase/polymerase protein [Chanos chanos]|uniref:DNA-directed primase/polymerase protein n=1 Tax=Chanos chanos TaxID=29144 RepID=A0A6J2WKA8_CHACN|nr:LOW QUALITY PROTEIN: DNA-directed primase/polymerase protein [Chanos chanos]
MKRGNWAERIKLVEKRAQFFQQTPICCPYKPRLSRPWQPSSVWRLFPRQSPAVAFSQTCKEDVHVFALERDQANGGQRIYLVTSYSELWHYYKTYRESLMHCYEVIPEGAVCKLYFDLEFEKAANPCRDGKEMVASLIEYVCEKLEEFYGLKSSSKDVLNLDSSTPQKFSRHLIFLLPNAAFKDNAHVGRFIHMILQTEIQTLQRKRSGSHVHRGAENVPESPPSKRRRDGERDLSFLVVKNKDGHDQLFVDLGVYTKNRNFRLYKSTKCGKNAAFTVAQDNRFAPPPDKQTTVEESIFLSSLITNVSFTGQRILTCDVPHKEEAQGLQSCSAQQTSTTISDVSGDQQCSPYREVDDFVRTLVCKDGIEGSIRRWSYFVSEQLLVYDILNYRWCLNIGRQHKSNNIMILVDLREEVWYQKCHDPECRRQNFRSSSYPLPEEVCMSHMLKEDEDDQQFLMDEAGNIELSQRPAVPGASGPGDGVSATADARSGDTEAWDDCPDDSCYLEALEEVERNVEEEVSDDLLIQAVAKYENGTE